MEAAHTQMTCANDSQCQLLWVCVPESIVKGLPFLINANLQIFAELLGYAFVKVY